ncbi:helix-hairpin-helix domain-containing protein [Streptomyces sp. NPDC086766]|uniref:helix-hairpin-helix domain-containing protein n=1 Tax=Streptomyces sp. NPDC086766 TaxID=3365754 RepID=UPI003810919E
MALRSRSRRTATATSGPNRAPASDGRTRHRRPPDRRGARRGHRRATGGAPGAGWVSGSGSRPASTSRSASASAEELRRRAEALFGERAGRVGESGSGPPAISGPSADAPRHAVAPPYPDGAARDGVRRRPSWAEDPEAAGHDPESGDAREGGTGPAAAVDMASPGPVPIPALASASVPGSAPGPDAARAWRERAGLALRDRMPLWLQARCGLERRNVVALTALLVLAAVLAAQHFWTGRTESVRAPEAVRAVVPYGGRGESRQAASGTSAAPPGVGASPGPAIVVDVSGKVRHPGIRRLPAGSRVADALRAAGGVRPGTETDGLNRARFLVDGEQVVVGGPAPAVGAPAGPVAGAAAGPVAAGAPATPVSLNTATADQLETLPGVGPVLAQHIVDYRTRHGGFRSVDQLREVTGIGDRRFADLRPLVRP